MTHQQNNFSDSMRVEIASNGYLRLYGRFAATRRLWRSPYSCLQGSARANTFWSRSRLTAVQALCDRQSSTPTLIRVPMKLTSRSPDRA